MFLIKTTLNYQLMLWQHKMYWLRHKLRPQNLAKVAIFASAGVVSVITLQFVYPIGMALPFARVGGSYVGFRSTQNISSELGKLNTQNLSVSLVDQEITTTPDAIGLEVDAQQAATTATNYSWRSRLIPFSMFYSHSNLKNLPLKYDQDKINAFASQLPQYNKQPTEAAVTINGDQVTVTESQNGYSYDPATSASALEIARFDNSMRITVVPTTVEPVISTDAANEAAQAITSQIAKPLSINADGQTVTVDPATIASWIVLTPNQDTHQLDISYDRAKIKDSLSPLSSHVYISQQPNTVVLVDGETDSSSGGTRGQILSVDDTIERIIQAVQAHDESVDAVISPVSPSTQYIRTYTRSSKGLQALINYWAQTHGGTYGISLQALDGSGISAAYNGSKTISMASLYKLYVIDVIYQDVQNGSLSLSYVTSTGYTVDQCISRAIIYSDNDCGVALGWLVGWSSSDGVLRSQGFGSTNLDAVYTSANDMTNFMAKLQNGSLVSSAYRSNMISLMEQQIYRSGIPYGSSGTVADKVGFIYSYNADTAIVYHPSGTYVLTVLSSGSSFSYIANLAKQISDVMSQ